MYYYLLIFQKLYQRKIGFHITKNLIMILVNHECFPYRKIDLPFLGDDDDEVSWELLLGLCFCLSSLFTLWLCKPGSSWVPDLKRIKSLYYINVKVFLYNVSICNRYEYKHYREEFGVFSFSEGARVSVFLPLLVVRGSPLFSDLIFSSFFELAFLSSSP